MRRIRPVIRKHHALTAWAVTSAFALAAVGCGGGGGGGEQAATPLTPITAQNADGLLGLTLSMSDLAFSIVRDTQETIRSAQSAGTLSGVIPCAVSGDIAWTLSDTDHSGGMTAGDVLRREYRNCQNFSLVAARNGEVIEVQLEAVPGVLDRLAGVISLVAGYSASVPGQGQIAFSGAARFEHSINGRSQVLTLLPATSLAITGTLSGVVVDERITNTSMVRTVDSQLGTMSQQIQFDYSSAIAKGPVEVRTVSPLTGDLHTYPHAGRIDINGGDGTSISLQTTTAPPRESLRPRAIATLQDVVQPVDVFGNWEDLVSSDFFWADGIVPRAGFPAVASERGLRILLSNGTADAQVPAQEWVFSRPIDATKVGVLQYSMHPANTSFDLGYIDTDWVPLLATPNVSVAGARVIARAPGIAQLGRVTNLEPVPGPGWATLAFGEPAWTDIYGGTTPVQVGGTPLPETLRAIIDYATPDSSAPTPYLQLTARESDLGTEGTQPIVSYRWTQLSGPPLRFSQPNGADTRVDVIGPWPTQDEIAMVDLEITNAAGQIDHDRMPVLLPKLDPTPWVFYVRSAPGSRRGDQAGTRRHEWDPTMRGTLFGGPLFFAVTFEEPSTFLGSQTFDVRLSMLLDRPIVRGIYNEVNSVHANGDQALSQSIAQSCTQAAVWTIEVFEYAHDGQGQIQTLAADYELGAPTGQCKGYTYGSIRINSTRPIRP